ncbi:MAG TPA: hypothetical protein VH858_05215 [Hyphomicrobiales bacterium]|jgi:hypothetical protein
MSRVIRATEQASFGDAETVRVMNEAFDQICQHLQDTGQPEIVREVIAEKIVAAAKRGERDPVRLRDIVLGSFGLQRNTG